MPAMHNDGRDQVATLRRCDVATICAFDLRLTNHVLICDIFVADQVDHDTESMALAHDIFTQRYSDTSTAALCSENNSV